MEEQNISQQIPPTETQTTSQKPRSNLLASVILALIMLGIGLGGGYVLFANKNYTPVQNTQSTPSISKYTSPTETPIQSASPTLATRSFSDSAAGYSLQYPADWTLQKQSEGCGPVFFAPHTKAIWFTVCGPYVNATDTPDNVAKNDVQQATIIEKSTTILDNKTGLKQELQYSDPSKSYYNYTISHYIGNVQTQLKDGNTGKIEKLTGTLVFEINIQDKTKVDEYKKSFNQILSTIKFINQ